MTIIIVQKRNKRNSHNQHYTHKMVPVWVQKYKNFSCKDGTKKIAWKINTSG